MNRREMITKTGIGIAGFAASTAFVAPSCGISKDKAVKFAGLVIDLSKEAVPLADLLGAHDIASLFSTKVIPVLEKLKDALAKADIPEAGTLLETVRNGLSAVATALLNLPDTARRTTVIGILASINILLLTVEAFLESETSMTAAAGPRRAPTGTRKPSANADAIRKAFEATRF